MKKLGRAVKPDSLEAGDKILPPAREVDLWMERKRVEAGLPVEALFLTVVSVVPGGKVDKKGPWTRVKAMYAPEFSAASGMTFLVRPTTDLYLQPWAGVKP